MELLALQDGVMLLVDAEGHRHAVRAGSVQALHETDDGTAIALRGGQIIPLVESFDAILAGLGWHHQNGYRK